MTKLIFLDCDGVLTNYNRHFKSIYEKITNKTFLQCAIYFSYSNSEEFDYLLLLFTTTTVKFH